MPAARKKPAKKAVVKPKLTPRQKREAKKKLPDYPRPAKLTTHQRKVYDDLFAKANYVYSTVSTVQIYMSSGLIYDLNEIDEEAADFVETCAPGLVSWCWTDSLIEAFKWKETPQGYDYWSDIYYKMINRGMDSMTPYYGKDGRTSNLDSDGDTDNGPIKIPVVVK